LYGFLTGEDRNIYKKTCLNTTSSDNYHSKIYHTPTARVRLVFT